MTEAGRPFDGIVTGDAGPYSSDDWSKTWDGAFARGDGYPNAGAFLATGTPPNNGLRVQAQSPTAAAVDVLKGTALINGRWYTNTATEALTIAANAAGNPRIDTIVLRCDYSLQTIRLAVLQGTAAASPTPPALTQTDLTLWEIPLADIAVANGFTSIAQTDITPRHEWANAPLGSYVIALNNSGGSLTDGTVVIWDTSADQAVTTTTTYNHGRVAGVIRGRVSNGGYALIQTKGIGYVVVDGSYSRGTGLYPGTTAGRAQGVSGVQNGTLGHTLEASTGAGQLIKCNINVQRRKNAIARYSYTVASGTTGTVYNAGANTVPLNTEDTDTNNIGTIASNQVTIQPGLYYVQGEATWYNTAGVRSVRTSIYDITGAAIVLTGCNQYAGATSGGIGVVSGYLLVTTPTVYELRVYCSGNLTTAPLALTTGASEVYGVLEFVRIDQ